MFSAKLCKSALISNILYFILLHFIDYFFIVQIVQNKNRW
nr:MAG TPA: hypothetical protein [Caudoviricetes sp.]